MAESRVRGQDVQAGLFEVRVVVVVEVVQAVGKLFKVVFDGKAFFLAEVAPLRLLAIKFHHFSHHFF